jgi:hypothetical protein
MIPPFFLGVLFLNVLLRENALLWPWDLFFAVSWPLVLAGVSWTIRWTLRNEPQHPRTDGHAFPIAFVVQWGGFFLLIPLIPGDYNPDWGLVLFGAPLAVLLFYMPEIAIYLETEYNDWIFGGGIGGLTGVLGVVLIATNWWPALGWLLLLAGVVILILIILGEYVEKISYIER